jgi:Tfp pilus assembly protein PilN
MNTTTEPSVEVRDDTALDFLPDDYVAARNRARANRLCGALLAIVIVSVAGAFGYAEMSLKSLRAEHETVTADFDRESARLAQLDTLRTQQQSVARRAMLAEALVEGTTRTALLGELTSLLPDGTSLFDLTLASKVRERVKTAEEILAEKQATRSTKPTPAIPQPKHYDVSLKLAGLAYTDVQVAQFISRLGRSPLFDDVNLLVSREFSYDGQLLRRFEVEMAVRPEPLSGPLSSAGSEVLR